MNTINTPRLLIRPFVMADLAELHQLLDHDLHWSGPDITLEQRRERLQREISLAEWEYAGGLCSYLAQPALRRYDPAAPPCPQINEGQFYLGQQESDWIIQRHILREQGVAVAGPPLPPMIDPVKPADLRGAVLGFLRAWWQPMLTNPARLQSSEYQAYAVLTMCRALHTLTHGMIVSKPMAARWAQAHLGEPWATVIADALVWRTGQSFNHFEAVVALIRHTVEQGSQSDAK